MTDLARFAVRVRDGLRGFASDPVYAITIARAASHLMRAREVAALKKNPPAGSRECPPEDREPDDFAAQGVRRDHTT